VDSNNFSNTLHNEPSNNSNGKNQVGIKLRDDEWNILCMSVYVRKCVRECAAYVRACACNLVASRSARFVR